MVAKNTLVKIRKELEAYVGERSSCGQTGGVARP